jgi:cytochrome c-type biogenesis protein CcmH/NrfG
MNNTERKIEEAIAAWSAIRSTKPADRKRKAALQNYIVALGGKVPSPTVSPPIGFIF